jgi:hypothetical protein
MWQRPAKRPQRRPADARTRAQTLLRRAIRRGYWSVVKMAFGRTVGFGGEQMIFGAQPRACAIVAERGGLRDAGRQQICEISLAEFRYNRAGKQVERASYNGSIEASQASDVGSIPIARSRF